MTTFRNVDFVSIQLIIATIFVTIILLIFAYFFLKILQKRLMHFGGQTKENLIHVLETKYIPNLGYLFLLSIDNKYFLALNSKLGTKMLQIKDDSQLPSEMDGKEVEH